MYLSPCGRCLDAVLADALEAPCRWSILPYTAGSLVPAAMIMSGKRRLDDDERAEFRNALKGVSPLSRPARQAPERHLPSPHPRFSEQDERDVIDHLLDHEIDP